MPATSAACRLKRENCPQTKHDSLFSPWKVLVGPSDWEDHSSGKEGVQRYRIRNLPDNFPGLYELGVAGASDEGVRVRRRDSGGVVVVYLGQADNVRARLQQYGRTGSHLDVGNSLGSAGKAEIIALAARPGLFREVFSKGYSVVFRCALMDNKQEAEKTEAQLLRVFDYAWNKLQNGACRREEILLKLEQGAFSHRSSLLSRVRYMKQKVFGEKAGIKIKRSESVDTSSGIMRTMLPRVRTFVRCRLQLVNSYNGGDEAIDIPWKKTFEGNTCDNRQAHRRRPEGYKVKKIDDAKRRTVLTQDSNSVCGVVLEDGSSCLEHPVLARKRCSLHKGRRVKGSSCSYPCQIEIPNTESLPRLTQKLNNSDQAHANELLSKNLATAMKEPLSQSSSFEAKEVKTGEAPIEDHTSRDAGICEEKTHHAGCESPEQQPSGRMWFDFLKAQKKSAGTLSSRGLGCQTRVTDDVAPICRALTDIGSCKMVPVAGRKGCEKHSGMKITGASFSRSSGWPCTCGARTSDGSPCMNQPVEGRKRCTLHKGQRASCPPTSSAE
ncbi:protein EFFECTOR OF TRANSCRIPTION 2-like [Phragmites australis]|uniref:protein EFFECTOR OF TRANSCRIPTION 2-like n=1 Tax=Phragmites australis TaxID=29695 RepID=UPI002D76E901|nr:protein EFFECTOR OF TRANSCRIPTION 2-like [Phragmites australis]